MLQWHSKSGVAYYESIHMSYMLLDSGLSIVPTKNMICNVGFSGGTHSDSKWYELPAFLKRIYTLKIYELESEIKHPPYVIEDCAYRRRVEKMMKYNITLFGRIIGKVQRIVRKLVGRFMSKMTILRRS